MFMRFGDFVAVCTLQKHGFLKAVLQYSTVKPQWRDVQQQQGGGDFPNLLLNTHFHNGFPEAVSVQQDRDNEEAARWREEVAENKRKGAEFFVTDGLDRMYSLYVS